ncbi:unnamed protein product, partial [marine sediment metagenome]
TGSYLFATFLMIAALLGGLIGAWQDMHSIDLVAALLTPLLQIILAVELFLNFVLDLYRPRIPGQEYHPSFESRLLSLVAEPERVGHSIAETLNYQFGFEVSKTWFYKLVARAFVPLLIFGALVLVGMSSFVVVREGERQVVLHWGRPDRVLEPGLHFKWPWPVDSSRRFQVDRVHEIMLGLAEAKPDQPDEHEEQSVFLWTEEHFQYNRKELDFLIAVPPRFEEIEQYGGEKPAPPVNIIKLVVPVQYVITDVYKYGFQVRDPKALLSDEAHREMIRYCASATLDSAVPGG